MGNTFLCSICEDKSDDYNIAAMTHSTDEGLVLAVGKTQEAKQQRPGEAVGGQGQQLGARFEVEQRPPAPAPASQAPAAGAPPAIASSAPAGPGKEEVELLTSLLQGRWIDRNTPEVIICEVRGSTLIWSEDLQNSIKFLGGNRFSIELDGETLTALYEPGSDPYLTWSDGAIWSMDYLHGKWYNAQDKSFIGEVRDGGHVYWDEKFCSLPSQIRHAQESPGKVFLTMEGTEASGKLEIGPQPKIRWEDDEVWIRGSAT